MESDSLDEWIRQAVHQTNVMMTSPTGDQSSPRRRSRHLSNIKRKCISIVRDLGDEDDLVESHHNLIEDQLLEYNGCDTIESTISLDKASQQNMNENNNFDYSDWGSNDNGGGRSGFKRRLSMRSNVSCVRATSYTESPIIENKVVTKNRINGYRYPNSPRTRRSKTNDQSSHQMLQVKNVPMQHQQRSELHQHGELQQRGEGEDRSEYTTCKDEGLVQEGHVRNKRHDELVRQMHVTGWKSEENVQLGRRVDDIRDLEKNKLNLGSSMESLLNECNDIDTSPKVGRDSESRMEEYSIDDYIYKENVARQRKSTISHDQRRHNLSSTSDPHLAKSYSMKEFCQYQTRPDSPRGTSPQPAVGRYASLPVDMYGHSSSPERPPRSPRTRGAFRLKRPLSLDEPGLHRKHSQLTPLYIETTGSSHQVYDHSKYHPLCSPLTAKTHLISPMASPMLSPKRMQSLAADDQGIDCGGQGSPNDDDVFQSTPARLAPSGMVEYKKLTRRVQGKSSAMPSPTANESIGTCHPPPLDHWLPAQRKSSSPTAVHTEDLELRDYQCQPSELSCFNTQHHIITACGASELNHTATSDGHQPMPTASQAVYKTNGTLNTDGENRRSQISLDKLKHIGSPNSPRSRTPILGIQCELEDFDRHVPVRLGQEEDDLDLEPKKEDVVSNYATESTTHKVAIPSVYITPCDGVLAQDKCCSNLSETHEISSPRIRNKTTDENHSIQKPGYVRDRTKNCDVGGHFAIGYISSAVPIANKESEQSEASEFSPCATPTARVRNRIRSGRLRMRDRDTDVRKTKSMESLRRKKLKKQRNVDCSDCALSDSNLSDKGGSSSAEDRGRRCGVFDVDSLRELGHRSDILPSPPLSPCLSQSEAMLELDTCLSHSGAIMQITSGLHRLKCSSPVVLLEDAAVTRTKTPQLRRKQTMRRNSSGSVHSGSEDSDADGDPALPTIRRGRRQAIFDSKSLGLVSGPDADLSPHNSCDEGDATSPNPDRMAKRSSVDLGINYPGDLLVHNRHSKKVLIKRNTIADFANTKAYQESTASLVSEQQDSKKRFSLLKLIDKKSHRAHKEEAQTIHDVLRNLKQSEFKDTHLMCYKALHWSELIASKDRDREAMQIPETERKRREAVWELFKSECVFLIDHIMVLKHCFLEPMKKVQVEGQLMFTEPQDLFGNLDELCYVSYTFCHDFISLLLKDATVTDFGRTPVLIRALEGFCKHTRDGEVYHDYCLNYSKAMTYLDTLRRNDDFAEFEKWSEQDPRCHRLQLTDLLISPMQHCTKMPLLLFNIRKYTEDEEERLQLTGCLEKLETSLKNLEAKMKWLKNFERVQEIQHQLHWQPITELDPRAFIPEFMKLTLNRQPCQRLLASPKRQLLHEGPLILYEINKTQDMHMFVFDDILLLTRTKKPAARKKSAPATDSSHSVSAEGAAFVVHRQPIALDRFTLHDVPSSDAAASGLRHAFVLVHISRFQQIIGVYTLQAQTNTAKVVWINKLRDAQSRYDEASTKRVPLNSLYPDGEHTHKRRKSKSPRRPSKSKHRNSLDSALQKDTIPNGVCQQGRRSLTGNIELRCENHQNIDTTTTCADDYDAHAQLRRKSGDSISTTDSDECMTSEEDIDSESQSLSSNNGHSPNTISVVENKVIKSPDLRRHAYKRSNCNPPLNVIHEKSISSESDIVYI